jgi:hypothetical protein
MTGAARALLLLALASCSAAPSRDANLWLRADDQDSAWGIYFEVQKLQPHAKTVVMRVTGRRAPPTIEAGEATVAYLYHLQPSSSSLDDDERSVTVILSFDHIPATPWRVELPSEGVELVADERGSGGRHVMTASAVKGWIQVNEAGDRALRGELDVALDGHIEKDGALPKPVKLYLRGRFDAVR